VGQFLVVAAYSYFERVKTPPRKDYVRHHGVQEAMTGCETFGD
jgi:hypothetical protein